MPISNRKIAAQEEHDPKTSLYLTSNDPEVAPFAQLLDWNARIGELFEIPTLLEQGINAESCLSHQIYIGYRGFLYGPITLEPERSNPQLLKPREYLLAQVPTVNHYSPHNILLIVRPLSHWKIIFSLILLL